MHHNWGHFGASAASFRGGAHLHHVGGSAAGPGGGAQQQQQRAALIKRAALMAVAGTAVGAGVMHVRRGARQHRPQLQPLEHQQRLLLPQELTEVLCGALGEIVQVALLYPLDTIKVRCQASGMSTAAVVRQLLASGSGTAVRQLYAGVMGASVASIAIGSLYYATFCAAKRGAVKMLGDSSSSNSSHADANGATHQHQQAPECMGQQRRHLPAPGVDHSHDAAAAARCSSSSTSTSSSNASCTAGDVHGASTGGNNLSSGLAANLLAACAAATVGALVEAPLELFKHRAQSGMLGGRSLLAAAASELRTAGPGALYGAFFLPFCLRSLPYDIAELLTVSSLQDVRAGAIAAHAHASAVTIAPEPECGLQFSAAALPLGSLSAASTAAVGTSRHSQTGLAASLAAVPEQSWDAIAGAAAGVAAVLVSMPADVIKTTLEVGRGAKPPSPGPLGSLAAFAATGRQLVATRGVAGGLFCGVGPRLAESVPSTVFYWLAVEGARRALAPYTAPAQ
jgi:solute carrier family 25 (mitochondrial S-adenosylmethionine transporter), member 26